MTEAKGAPYRSWRREMPPRSIDEGHRAATMLELFFDLCFVVAVAQAAASLHHAASAGQFVDALTGFPLVFFAIWWAWMNFTWFASAYDNDDSVYRLAVMFIMAGVLVLAAGVPRAFEESDWRVMTLGFAVMRVPLAGLWLRAAYHHPGNGLTQKRYALGILLCMVGWGALLLVPGGFVLPGFIVMATLELLVPVWAERKGATPWHAHHITSTRSQWRAWIRSCSG